MATLDEMLKKIVLAGRDEGFMEPGDNVSATGEVLVIFGGNEQVYDEDLDQENADENSEIYDIYIHVDATADPVGHFKLPYLWPVKLLQAGWVNYQSSVPSHARRAAASLSR